VIEEVMEGVRWIKGNDGYLPDSHAYVIGLPGSGDFTMVDCGLMGNGAYKLDALDKAGIRVKDLKRIIMTHTHLDHIGCLPEILGEAPHAEVWMHAAEGLPLEKGDDRIVWGNSMFKMMVQAQYRLPKDGFCRKVHRKLEDGESLSLGGLEFKVIFIPGHSCGHIGLFNEKTRAFFSGDTIYADYAIGRYDLASANAADLRASLEKIDGLGVDVLLPCHNRIVRGGAAPMIHETVKQWGPMLR
jgi:glyoxylase-like metal-dependent hydrolase (beta-lactamase superfamily II)